MLTSLREPGNPRKLTAPPALSVKGARRKRCSIEYRAISKSLRGDLVKKLWKLLSTWWDETEPKHHNTVVQNRSKEHSPYRPDSKSINTSAT